MTVLDRTFPHAPDWRVRAAWRITSDEACPTCGGDGAITTRGAGYFDIGFGNYLPNDREEACSTCGSTGRVRVEVDPLTLHPTSTCRLRVFTDNGPLETIVEIDDDTGLWTCPWLDNAGYETIRMTVKHALAGADSPMHINAVEVQ